MKDFHSLSQREVLALAISLEEEDDRQRYRHFERRLRLIRSRKSGNLRHRRRNWRIDPSSNQE